MKKTNELRTGVNIFLILAVLTALEYIAGVAQVPSILMWIVALVKAGLVIWFFMHIARVFRSQGGHE